MSREQKLFLTENVPRYRLSLVYVSIIIFNDFIYEILYTEK